MGAAKSGLPSAGPYTVERTTAPPGRIANDADAIGQHAEFGGVLAQQAHCLLAVRARHLSHILAGLRTRGGRPLRPARRRRIGVDIGGAVLQDKRVDAHLVQPFGNIHSFIRHHQRAETAAGRDDHRRPHRVAFSAG